MSANIPSTPEASGWPIMLLTHTRACSTAFERVLMTRRDAMVCLNEPFADPSFFGPEACVERHHASGEKGAAAGFQNCTFKQRMELIENENRPDEGKRAFVKDMAFQLSPWRERDKLQIAESLRDFQSEKDVGNPTVLPLAILQGFQWTFLIRHPQKSIPSLFRLSSTEARREATGWRHFLPSEAGYYELRRMFDHLMDHGLIPGRPAQIANGEQKQQQQKPTPCLLDADDLLRRPENAVKAYCRHIGLDYQPSMLQWDSKEDDDQAAQVFATWTAFHMDAIKSRGLTARGNKPHQSQEEDFKIWVEEFGNEGANMIQKTIEWNLPHYLYLKQFAIRIEE